jgi:putative transposase
MAGRIYVLLTWTTRNREPLITPDVDALLMRLLPRVAKAHRTAVLALGIVSDHVHIVLRLPLQFDIPRLAQGLEGSSSRIANRDGIANPRLAWADGYDVRSIGVRSVQDARDYVRNQKFRHGLLKRTDLDQGGAS